MSSQPWACTWPQQQQHNNIQQQVRSISVHWAVHSAFIRLNPMQIRAVLSTECANFRGDPIKLVAGGEKAGEDGSACVCVCGFRQSAAFPSTAQAHSPPTALHQCAQLRGEATDKLLVTLARQNRKSKRKTWIALMENNTYNTCRNNIHIICVKSICMETLDLIEQRLTSNFINKTVNKSFTNLNKILKQKYSINSS